MDVADTPRLLIRELTLDDAPFIVDLLTQPSFIQFIGDRGVRDLETAREYLRKGPLQSYATNGFGLYAVTLKSTTTSIGMCGIVKRDALPSPDIGFAFLPAFEGQGFAFEAAAATLHYARNFLRLPKLLAIVQPDNPRSIKLLDKLGFAFIATTRLSADDVELNVMSISF